MKPGTANLVFYLGLFVGLGLGTCVPYLYGLVSMVLRHCGGM